MIEENNIEYRRRLAIRDVIAEVIKTKKEISAWIENESVIDIYKNFINVSELSYLDLAALLYLMVKLEGKKSSNEIKHIVIDEAQDFNMLQFIALKEFTGCRSYTIVGDANQRLIRAEEVPAMLRLEELFNNLHQLFELNKSYEINLSNYGICK